jgi:uncharacterized protein YbaP (TraB family)
MRRFIYFLALFFGFTTPALSQCVGEDLIDAMTDKERATFYSVVNAQPFPRGNYWRATRGDQDIHVLGTFHLDDPRHADTMERIIPQLEASDLIMLEASRNDVDLLKQFMANNPGIMFNNTGPTLPDQLPEETWQKFSTEMSARGIPSFLAAKFRPGYATMILGIPPCAMDFRTGTEPEGLDYLIQDYAQKNALATKGLEPFDTALQIFALLEEGDPLEALRLGIAMTNDADNSFVTLRDEYFRGEHGAIWEFGRSTALATPGMDAEMLAKDFDKLEKVSLVDRNAACIPVMFKVAEYKSFFVSVGASHLTGETGILNLLANEGFTLYPLD